MVLGFFDQDSTFLGASPFLTKRKGLALMTDLMNQSPLADHQFDLSLLDETTKEELIRHMKQQKEGK